MEENVGTSFLFFISVTVSIAAAFVFEHRFFFNRVEKLSILAKSDYPSAITRQ